MNARSHTTATPAPAITLAPEVAADPVVKLALQVRTQRELAVYLDVKHTAAQKASGCSHVNIWESAHKDAYDAECSLRDCLGSVQATSMEGAAIHIAEALARFDSYRSQIDDSSLDWPARFDARAVDRMLYSALNIVLSAAQHRVADIAGEGFDSPQCNPWTRVAYVEAKEAGQ